jgi:ArsR family transcriptional regulator, lead/cadmium/zinc/bismuth-responsive transcriptional repressor
MRGCMGTIADDAEFADHLAGILKALANPPRLRLVAALDEGSVSVGTLADRLGLPPAIVSQQLRILRMEGLVRFERSGGFALYALAEPRLRSLLKCLEKCPRA